MYRKIVYLIIFSTLTLADEKSISPKIGLVLSGGGAKGFAHVGVLKVLDSLQINIDYIAATSFGAITGSLYAIGKSGKELEKWDKKLIGMGYYQTCHLEMNYLTLEKKKQVNIN